MDVKSVGEIFKATLDPSLQAEAGQQLTKLKSTPKSLEVVLTLIGLPETEPNVKLAASIFLKNRCVGFWEKNYYTTTDEPLLTQDEKNSIRAGILNVMVLVPDNIRKMLAQAVHPILQKDYPKQWPEFLPALNTLLKSDQYNMMYTGLLCLYDLIKIYQYKKFKDSIPLKGIVDGFFPQLNSICLALIQVDTPEAAQVVHLCFKIYRKSIKNNLVPSQQEPATLISWGNLFIQVVEKAIPLEALPQDESERERLPWVKARKWAFECLNFLFSRYGNPTKQSEKSKYYKFSIKFMKHFAPNVLKVYLEQMTLFVNRRMWLSKACLVRLIEFLNEAVSHKVTWQGMEPHLEPIVKQLIFPFMQYNEADLERWDENPVDFLNRHIYFTDFSSGVALCEPAGTLLNSLVDTRRKQALDGILNFIFEVVRTNNSNNLESDRAKDGALAMIEAMVDVLTTASSKVRAQMEQFCIELIFPEVNNPNKMLRFRACMLISKFSEGGFVNESTGMSAFNAIVPHLKDSELIVRATSAMCLEHLIAYETIGQSVTPHLSEIMETLLVLSSQIDFDALTKVIETFVDHFPTDLKPYYVQLSHSLVTNFMRLTEEVVHLNETNGLDEFDGESDETLDKIDTASGYLRTLGTIIFNLNDSHDIISQLEPIVLPTIKIVFSTKSFDLQGEAFELIDSFIFSLKEITPTMRQVIDIINVAVEQGYIDYMTEVFNLFDNYVAYDGPYLSNHPDSLQRPLAHFNTCVGDPTTDFTEKVMACKMAISMLLNVGPIAPQIIPGLLDTVFPVLGDDKIPKGKMLTAYLLKVPIISLAIDMPTTLRAMEQKNFTAGFFDMWFRNFELFFGVHDKKAAIIALCNLIVQPFDSFPQSVQSGWNSTLSGILQNFKSLPEAFEKKFVAIKEFQEDDDYDSVYAEDGNVDTKGNLTPQFELTSFVDGEDEEEENFDELARLADLAEEAASHLPTNENASSSNSFQYDDDEEEEEDITECDPIKSSITNLDIYDFFRKSYQQAQTLNAGFELLHQGLDNEAQKLLQEVLQLDEQKVDPRRTNMSSSNLTAQELNN